MTKRRTLMVAIDGACWAYVDPLLASGRMPHLTALRRRGVHGVLESPLPPLTPVAWASLITGKLPGRHGIYNWVVPDTAAARFRPVSGGDCAGTPVWDRLTAAGLRVGLVNAPLTHPPPRLDGFVVGGFMAPDEADDLCHPPSLGPALDERFGGYVHSMPAEQLTVRNPAVFDLGRRVQLGQVGAALLAAERHPVDVLVINLMFFDQANHVLPSLADVERALVCCDEDLGTLIDGFAPDTVLLFSDHGTRRVEGRFLLGRWLLRHGYQVEADAAAWRRGYLNQLLSGVTRHQLGWTGVVEKALRRAVLTLWEHAPHRLDLALWRLVHRYLELDSFDLWLAPRLDPWRTSAWVPSAVGAIYVAPFDEALPAAARSAIAGRLRAELAAVRDPRSGAPLFAAVHDGRELYGPAAVGGVPDLVLDSGDSRWDFSLVRPPPHLSYDGDFIDRPGRYGEHARDGLFVFAGPDIRCTASPRRAHLVDLTATLLYLHGVAVPDDYDSVPMTDALEPELLRRRSVARQPGDDPSVGSAAAEVDSADLERRLRALGYLE